MPDVFKHGLLLMAIAASCMLRGACAEDALRFEASIAFPELPADVLLGKCSAVAANSKGEIYLLHRGPRPVLCVDGSGHLLRAWGDNELGTPHGLRVDPDDNIWITDMGRHRVLKFDPTGRLLLSMGTGEAGTSNDTFDRPTDVAFASNGDVFVSDGYGNNRVMKFNSNGKFLKSWGTKGTQPGEFDLPHAILVDAKGRVLVGDSGNKRIQRFDAEGKFLDEWTGFAPYGIAIDPDGKVFVADIKANQVLRLDEAGKVTQRWGARGTAAGELGEPHMIAFDAHGNLFVAEVGNMRFQKFTKK